MRPSWIRVVLNPVTGPSRETCGARGRGGRAHGVMKADGWSGYTLRDRSPDPQAKDLEGSWDGRAPGAPGRTHPCRHPHIMLLGFTMCRSEF